MIPSEYVNNGQILINIKNNRHGLKIASAIVSIKR